MHNFDDEKRIMVEAGTINKIRYEISHDLRTPLHAVNQLASWLIQDYAVKLDEEGKHQLELIASRTEQMALIIDGILRKLESICLSEKADRYE